MSIGSTIKKLRQDHDMTQEQLADLLLLTPAAISGWECDRNSPDISQLPLLSRIFGVSADVLLGIDLSIQENRIDEIICNAAKCTASESVKIYRLGLAEFPASYKLMLHLADNLDYAGEPKTYDTRQKERIALYEKIREGTKDAYLKNCAEGRLCNIYLNQGKRDESLKIADSIPRFMYSHDDLKRMLAQGKEKVYNMHYSIQYNFSALCDDIYFFALLDVDGKPFFSNEQKITILEKIPKLHEIFFENGDFLNQSWIVAWAYTRMAEIYADMKDSANTIRCLESAIEFAKKDDEYYDGVDSGFYGISDAFDHPQLPKEKRHTSILAAPELDYPTTTTYINKRDGETQTDLLKKAFSHSRFDFVRDKVNMK